MPYTVAELRGMLKYVDSKFENHPHAYVSMELVWLVVWALAMPVSFSLKESRTPKIFVFAKKGQSSPTGKVIV